MDKKTVGELKESRSQQAKALWNERKRFKNLNLSDKDQLQFRDEKYSKLLADSKIRSSEQGKVASSAAKRRAGLEVDSKSLWIGNAPKPAINKIMGDFKAKGINTARLTRGLRRI